MLVTTEADDLLLGFPSEKVFGKSLMDGRRSGTVQVRRNLCAIIRHSVAHTITYSHMASTDQQSAVVGVRKELLDLLFL